MAGCCHGRPSRWGVCYREKEAAAGFTPYYTGIRLFPIQGIESLWVMAVVLTGSRLVWTGQAAGTALAWYLLAYSIGRFGFEFLRGDPARPYWLGFSAAQWLSLLLVYGVVGLELAGFLPYHAWHSAAALGLSAVMAGIHLNRAKHGWRYALLQPRHVEEIAAALNQVVLPDGQELPPVEPPVACTSLGIQISAGKVRYGPAWVEHFTISSRLGSLTEEAARMISGLIVLLQKRNPAEEHVFQGRPGVYHLLIQAPAQDLKPADLSRLKIDGPGET